MYKTESDRNNPTPVFEAFEISVNKLVAKGDFNQEFKIEWFDEFLPTQSLGFIHLTLNDIFKLQKKRFSFLAPASRSSTDNTLILVQSLLTQEGTFLEFILGGVQLQVILGIDFTSENVTNEEDLHSVSYDGSLNTYQQLIKYVCQTLLNYDINKMVPVFGFGGKNKYEETDEVNHCFPLGWEPSSPGSRGIGGIFQVYNKFTRMVELAGPRLLLPTLEKFFKLTDQNDEVEIYSAGFIFTVGDPADFEECARFLKTSSDQPISIFIIGIGQASFSKLRTLEKILEEGAKQSTRQVKMRNNVKFKAIYDFGPDLEALVSLLLKTLEIQMVKYMHLHKITPKPPSDIDLKGFRV